jgi:4-amino-4-deoxy-L-arabinose transferase-like glycosyltransferase
MMSPTEVSKGGAYFRHMVAAAVALGAAIRLAYVAVDDRVFIGGDAFSYHFEALRLADGLGYTSSFGDVGAPIAHHPPGWLTLLGLVSWLGGRSMLAHQLTGVGIGLGVVVLAGLVGRRYFSPATGVIAAAIAALYPGFWVIDTQILSEPLGLLLVGFLTLAIADLRERPTPARSIGIGAICGLLALVRSEQLALLAIVVVPVLLRVATISLPRRVARAALAAITCAAVISPWVIYNATRFKEPVFLSTNGAGTLLAGNCPPATYGGERLGYFDSLCELRTGQGLDRSQGARLCLDLARRNIVENLHRLPIVVAARFGRTLAVFRPSQTVGFIADWMKTGTGPIWAWVVSYWLLLALAITGGLAAWRRGSLLWPLVAPLLVMGAVVAVAYGEPRYHTPSDLGVVVLAAAGVEGLLARRRT